jgi:hypothetical protein
MSYTTTFIINIYIYIYMYINKLILVEEMKELTRLEFNDISDRYIHIYVYMYIHIFMKICTYEYEYLYLYLLLFFSGTNERTYKARI